jgi:hypothetical protein
LPAARDQGVCSEAVNEVEIKGAVMLSCLTVVEREYGADVRSAILSDLAADPRAALHGGEVLSGGFYPCAWHRELLGGIARRVGEEAFLEVARASVAENVNTIYRMVFKLLSPSTGAANLDRVFHMFYRGGVVTILGSTSNSVRVEYTECWGFDRLMWLAYLAGAEHALKMIGANTVHTRIEKMDGPYLLGESRWT